MIFIILWGNIDNTQLELHDTAGSLQKFKLVLLTQFCGFIHIKQFTHVIYVHISYILAAQNIPGFGRRVL